MDIRRPWGIINCPCEIAECVGSICIVNNDDFKIDTLAGQAQQAHRINVMFVQPKCIEKKLEKNPYGTTLRKNKKEISEKKDSSIN